MPRLLVVIPAYNEESRLGPSLARLRGCFQAAQLEAVTILVSSNGSVDRTADVAKAAGVACVTAVNFPDKGLAIHRAWRLHHQDCDVLAYCDADMATDPEALVLGLALIRSGQADAVVGSRWHPQSKIIGRGPGRSFLSRTLSFFWKLLPGSVLSDPGCGLKLIKTEAFLGLPLNVNASGFAFGGEVMVRLQRAGGRVVEIPVTWTDDRARRLRLGKAAWDYAKAWWRLFLRLA